MNVYEKKDGAIQFRHVSHPDAWVTKRTRFRADKNFCIPGSGFWKYTVHVEDVAYRGNQPVDWLHWYVDVVAPAGTLLRTKVSSKTHTESLFRVEPSGRTLRDGYCSVDGVEVPLDERPLYERV